MLLGNWRLIKSKLAALTMPSRSAFLTNVLMFVAASDVGAATSINSTLDQMEKLTFTGIIFIPDLAELS